MEDDTLILVVCYGYSVIKEQNQHIETAGNHPLLYGSFMEPKRNTDTTILGFGGLPR